MTETTISCEYGGCDWVSVKAKAETCVQQLQIHTTARHAQPSKSAQGGLAKPEKAKRPELAGEMSDEDWVYFKSRWKEYKKATGITGDDIIIQLMECCCDSIRRDHHRTFSKAEGESATAVTEEERLKELKQLAVRKKNKAVNMVYRVTTVQPLTIDHW